LLPVHYNNLRTKIRKLDALKWFRHLHLYFVQNTIFCSCVVVIRYSMRLDMLRGAAVFLYSFWYSYLPFIPIVSIIFLIPYTLDSLFV